MLSPAVKTTWSSLSFPSLVANLSRVSRFCSRISVFARSHAWPEILAPQSGYEDLMRSIVVSIFDWRELETTTVAPDSILASATQKPIPDVPPRTRTRLLRSFEVYLEVAGTVVIMVVVKQGKARVRLLCLQRTVTPSKTTPNAESRQNIYCVGKGTK